MAWKGKDYWLMVDNFKSFFLLNSPNIPVCVNKLREAYTEGKQETEVSKSLERIKWGSYSKQKQ